MSSYLIPQECGNRTGIRYMEITDETQEGIRFSFVDKPIEGSVLPYSAAELENAMHIEELPQSSYTWVRVLGQQMGVGGDDSWGAPVQEIYTIPKSKFTNLNSTYHLQSKKLEKVSEKCQTYVKC